MITFAKLKEDTLRYFDIANESDNDADVTLVSAALNAANQKRSTEDRWKFMLSSVYSIVLTRGVQEYILPQYNLHKIHYLYNSTQGQFAEQLPAEQGAWEVECPSNGGYYYDVTDAGSVVAAQPSAPDTITVTSTEVETEELYVEGEDSDGNPINDSLAPGDTSTNTYAKVTYYAKTGDWDGTLTLTTTGAETLITLGPSESGREYPVLSFYSQVLAPDTFQYKYFRKPKVMTRELDRPDIPFPHSGVLVYDALLDLATYNELDSESVNIWREKQQEYVDILYQQKLEGDSVRGRNITGSAGY